MHPFLDHPGPIAFAHRGGAGDAPENTLVAFDIAVTLGYRYLETDAHLTRDGVLVAFHDDRLDRVTDRTGAIAALDIGEVEAADAGYTFSRAEHLPVPRPWESRSPRLEDLLARWPEVRVNIDPKADACVVATRGAPRPAKRMGSGLHRIVLGSPPAVDSRAWSWPGVHVDGAACRCTRPCCRDGRADAAASAPTVCRCRPIEEESRSSRSGLWRPRIARVLPVHAWTINDGPTIDRLLDLGVDGIMTDRHRLPLDVLRHP